MQTVLPGGINASPLDGVVAGYRVQYGDWGDVRLRVLRPAGGGSYSAVASGATDPIGTTFDELVRIFPTRLPIAQGDQIGIDSTSVARLTGLTGADYAYWSPVLAGGDPPSAPTPTPGNNSALTFNADVEPDADRDGFGDETQDLCPTNAATQQACPLRRRPRRRQRRSARGRRGRAPSMRPSPRRRRRSARGRSRSAEAGEGHSVDSPA